MKSKFKIWPVFTNWLHFSEICHILFICIGAVLFVYLTISAMVPMLFGPQMSSTDALGPKLEQHTYITWTAEVNVICMPRWEGGGGVSITCSSNILVMLTIPAIYIKYIHNFWQTRCSRGCPTNSLVINSLSDPFPKISSISFTLKPLGLGS